MVGGPTSVKFVLKKVKWGQGWYQTINPLSTGAKSLLTMTLNPILFFSVKIIIIKNLAVISIKIAN